MAEYIDREALMKAYVDLCLVKSRLAKSRKGAAFFRSDLLPEAELTDKEWVRLINATPAADVVEVRHGKWVDHMVRDWRCSICGEKINKVRNVDGYCYEDKPHYCPNCGARMDGE